jgi:glycolate oxidase FAD binding subunit
LEGTQVEVDWMVDRLAAEWSSFGAANQQVQRGDAATALWEKLRDFPAVGDSSLVIKASMLPSKVTDFISLVLTLDAQAAVQAHAGTGVVIVRFSTFGADQISRGLIGRLQPAAKAAGGSIVVLSSSGLGDLTRQATWGGAEASRDWMAKIKTQFDPHDLLNPGRFLYA